MFDILMRFRLPLVLLAAGALVLFVSGASLEHVEGRTYASDNPDVAYIALLLFGASVTTFLVRLRQDGTELEARSADKVRTSAVRTAKAARPDWVCEACGYENPGRYDGCNGCGSARP